MAVPHFSIKNGARGCGEKHADYIAGFGKFGDRADVVYCEDGNLPTWASDASDFFRAADQFERNSYAKTTRTRSGESFEKEINGRAYKEIEIAIPRETSSPEEWAKEYVRDKIGNRHAYRLAVHDKEASDGGRNCHMHLMFSTRTMDGFERSREKFFSRAAGRYRHRVTKEMQELHPSRGGARKDEEWDTRKRVIELRADFEQRVQRDVPGFRLGRSEHAEPKIGPRVKGASKEFEAARQQRADDVAEMRVAKKELAGVDLEIGQAKKPVDWSQFKNSPSIHDGSSPDRKTLSDWSHFKNHSHIHEGDSGNDEKKVASRLDGLLKRVDEKMEGQERHHGGSRLDNLLQRIDSQKIRRGADGEPQSQQVSQPDAPVDKLENMLQTGKEKKDREQQDEPAPLSNRLNELFEEMERRNNEKEQENDRDSSSFSMDGPER